MVFMVETNPGPGLGIQLAYSIVGRRGRGGGGRDLVAILSDEEEE